MYLFLFYPNTSTSGILPIVHPQINLRDQCFIVGEHLNSWEAKGPSIFELGKILVDTPKHQKQGECH